MSEEAASADQRGKEAFKAKDYPKAIEEFEKAAEITPEDHKLYGNISACYFNQNKFDEALKSAERCIEVNPAWDKGYQRRGLALAKLDKKEEAREAFVKGLEINPDNAQIKQALQELDNPTPNQGEDNPFFNAEAMGKIMTNPKTKAFFDDPDFKNKFEFCKHNPQMMMQLMQTDPRFMAVFQVITGIDLEQMQTDQKTNSGNMEEMKKQREAQEQKKKEDEEAKKKQEEEDKLPNEEKEKLQKHKEADEAKDKGNTAYKAKNFEEALGHYDQAIELFPSDLTYYTNKAAVHFEMKEYDNCIALCERAEEIAKEGYYDFKKLGKALARKGNALAKLQRYDEAIVSYKKALLEHNDYSFKDALKKVEKIKKKFEEEAYIDPAKSEEHREAGNALFKEGNFPGAIKEYDEGLKRDPKNVKIYSNRSFAYIKLMEFPSALKDISKGLDLDPEFVKLWVRKGS